MPASAAEMGGAEADPITEMLVLEDSRITI
jgi:hypothetical protein